MSPAPGPDREGYARALSRLEGRISAGIRPGLDRTRELLADLGNPDRSYRTVQVAGTNGKGSTCRFLHRILGRAGLRTGLFTSPHLLSVRERLIVGESAISEAEFQALAEEVLPRAERLDATYFETLTAMGALWFQKKGVEIAVLETGLGGRLDSTTAMECSVFGVAQVGLDHCQLLGDTVEKIWDEKIAILRNGGTLFTLETRPHLVQALRSLARERHGRAVLLERPDPSRFLHLDLPPGPHQIDNLHLAKALAESILQRPLEDPEIHAALQGMIWPGRFQRIPGEIEHILDVGHNPDAAKALSVLLQEIRPVLLFSAMADKEFPRVLEILSPHCRSIHLTATRTARSASVEALQAACPGGIPHDGIDSAWFAAVAEARRAAVPLLVCGSFHVVGHVLGRLVEGGETTAWPEGILPDPSLPAMG